MAILMLPSWMVQRTPGDASLRGLAVVTRDIVWASGSQGTWLRTTDGGRNWQMGRVPGAEKMDFRDVAAWDEKTALLLASGPGDASRIYRTRDGGEHWELMFTNPDTQGFFDALAFRDQEHGLLLGDPVDGRFVIFLTKDGGASWQRQSAPDALPGEGAFAASGTCLTITHSGDAWFVTGGGDRARLFHSKDGGASWTVQDLRIEAKKASAGAFSVSFRDPKHGIVAGGDYKLGNEARGTLTWTDDGGRSWHVPTKHPPTGFRSAVTFVPGKLRTWIVAGTNGTDISKNDGRTWRRIEASGLNAVGAAENAIWAVGSHGLVVKLNGD